MTHSTHSQPTDSTFHTATSVSTLDHSGSNKNERSRKARTVKKPARDIYQEVTDRVIKALEKGVKPWVCPWDVRGAGSHALPCNYVSGQNYSGINIFLLWESAAEQGFDSRYWMTFKQAKEKGGHVRKGEKGTQIVFYKIVEKEDKETEEVEQFPVLKTYTVFNANQIEGLEFEDLISQPIINSFEALEHVEALIEATGADITERGVKAFYQPAMDKIYLPERHYFENESNFYATVLHELTHWTGNNKRLDRSLKNRFGSEGYAFEELIAELGSAFLMADLGIIGEVQHADYIGSWLKKLKEDKRFIFKAASQASKAHQFIMTCQNQSKKAA